jgi:hypothetical protein
MHHDPPTTVATSQQMILEATPTVNATAQTNAVTITSIDIQASPRTRKTAVQAYDEPQKLSPAPKPGPKGVKTPPQLQNATPAAHMDSTTQMDIIAIMVDVHTQTTPTSSIIIDTSTQMCITERRMGISLMAPVNGEQPY